MKEKTTKICTEALCGKWFPILLLVIMACTYAIQLPQLGFYLDDWVSITAYDQGGEAGLIAFGVNDSRPFAAWVTAKFFSILGTGVLPWQLITLFWRYAAAIVSFLLLRSVWPERKSTAGFISLLFGVFPYFKHQPICIAYFMILMQYFTVLFSFLLTVKALQAEKSWLRIFLFVLSCLTSVFHLACLEYYLSLEAARFFLIFFVLKKRDGASFRKTLVKSLLIYIPYALILIGILGYRFVYIPSLSKDVRPVNMFTKYKGLNIIFHFVGLALQYLTESVMGVWYRSINPSGLDLTVHNTQLGLGLGLAAAIVVFFILHKVHASEHTEKDSDSTEMLILGIAAMVLGFLPGMAIDASPATNSNYSDRFLLPSFWGIAIFTVVWITSVFRNRVVRNILLSSLICIAVLFQIQNAFMYRYSWKYQQQFQWEMKWRIPDLEANTAVIADGVVASFMGGWADSSMLNEMYGKKEGINPTPYWYFTVGDDNYLSVLGTDNNIYIKSKMYEFNTNAENVIVVTKPEYGKCFWLIDEVDVYNPDLETGVYTYVRYQNKDRIITDSNHVLPEAIFGTDYTHDWCYYFEKADLAFDLGEYDEALRLYDEAATNGIKSGNQTEMRPFIKAAAFTGDWEKALAWSEEANAKIPNHATNYFRQLWRIIDRDAPDSPGKAEAVAEAQSLFGQ